VYQKQNYKTIIKSNLTVAATAASSSSKEALAHAEIIAMSEWMQRTVLAGGASIAHLYRSAYLQVGE
jgi:hypothetical protein